MKPCYKFIGNSIEQQVLHVRSESKELLDAALDKDYNHAVEETWDVIQSCYTLLAIFQLQGYDIENVHDWMVAKNESRNYYDNPNTDSTGAEISE